MTSFELWRAGLGPEPVVVADPETLALWVGRLRRRSKWSPYCSIGNAPEQHEREEAEAAEECRAALEAALACLPDFTYPFTCPYDEQQCERPRCYATNALWDSECAKRRFAAPARRRPCAS